MMNRDCVEKEIKRLKTFFDEKYDGRFHVAPWMDRVGVQAQIPASLIFKKDLSVVVSGMLSEIAFCPFCGVKV